MERMWNASPMPDNVERTSQIYALVAMRNNFFEIYFQSLVLGAMQM